MKVTIKDKEYELGGVAFSDANLEVFGKFSNLSDDDDSDMVALMKQFKADFLRMLKEAIEDGEGDVKKADEAIKNLRLSFNPESDLMRAFQALMQSLMA